MSLVLRPSTLREANAFVKQHHRHHPMVRGCRFALAAERDGEVVGVAIVGRPVSRHLDNGLAAEVNRLCVVPDERARNACSLLYGAAARAWRAMGGERMFTYIRADESGASLRASGWVPVHATRAQSHDRARRPRQDRTEVTERVRYEPPWSAAVAGPGLSRQVG